MHKRHRMQVAARNLTGKVVAFFTLCVPFIGAGGIAYCFFSGTAFYDSVFEAYAVLFNVPGAAVEPSLFQFTCGVYMSTPHADVVLLHVSPS